MSDQTPSVTIHQINERQAVAEIASQVRDDIGAATIRLAAILAKYPEARQDLYAAQDALTMLIVSLTGYAYVEY